MAVRPKRKVGLPDPKLMSPEQYALKDGVKKCSWDGEYWPTLEYFGTIQKGKYWESICRPCKAEKKRQMHKDDPERMNANQKRHREKPEIRPQYLKRSSDHYYDNWEEIRERARQKYWEDPQAALEKNKADKKARETPESRKAENARIAKWKRDHPESRRKLDAKYYQIPAKRLMVIARARHGVFVRAMKAKKNISVSKALGCTSEEYRDHLESLWEKGMTWENHGKDGLWEIDHRIPMIFFDPNNAIEMSVCEHFFNKQPLWKTDHDNKQDHIDPVTGPKFLKALFSVVDCPVSLQKKMLQRMKTWKK